MQFFLWVSSGVTEVVQYDKTGWREGGDLEGQRGEAPGRTEVNFLQLLKRKRKRDLLWL